MIALLVVGPQRLPGLARSIGRGVRDLRNAVRSAGQELGVRDLEQDLRDLNDLRHPARRFDVAKELGLDHLGLDETGEELEAGRNADEVVTPPTADEAPTTGAAGDEAGDGRAARE